jgi:hypothetical protein
LLIFGGTFLFAISGTFYFTSYSNMRGYMGRSSVSNSGAKIFLRRSANDIRRHRYFQAQARLLHPAPNRVLSEVCAQTAHSLQEQLDEGQDTVYDSDNQRP